MPIRDHSSCFQVRFYECDAYGHVNHANYLRYMAEAAFAASADAGYDTAAYEAMGRYWLVREMDVEYLAPLRYGDTVCVRTWVEDFRRVRSRRLYELTRGDGQLAARGATDWVFLDRQSNTPATIPPEMIAAFMPDGPGSPARREPFPIAPPPPPGIFRQRRLVEWRDIDPAGHVNNAVYLAYTEDCGVQTALAHGWPMGRMMAAGFAIVARRYRIEYLQPALLGDELEVTTFVADVKRATAVRHYTIRRLADNALLARAYALWVWVDLASGRPIRVPADFLADFAANIVPAAG
jgi:acyl-CoA thioester hydrolase